MICADTSSFVAFLDGEAGGDVELIIHSLGDRSLVLAPASISELLSNPFLTPPLEQLVLGIPQIEITSGYWERAGKLRARMMRHRFRPKLVDTLIAQSCLDHEIALVTRDRDFSAFQKVAGLQLLSGPRRVQ